MPNWCSQDLFITGKIEERERFIKAVEITSKSEHDNDYQKHSILSMLFPMPEALTGIHSGFCTINGVTVENWREIDGENVPLSIEESAKLMLEYGATNWYDWGYLHWGTKWGDCDTVLHDHNAKKTIFYFESAWGPITKGLLNVSRLFPKLRFTLKYYEQGMGFRGTDVFKNGGMISEKYFENYRGGRGG